MSIDSKGIELEGRVLTILEELRMLHPERVRVVQHPTLDINDGHQVFLDFELIMDMPFKPRRYFIVCHNRKRSKHDIQEKIQYVKKQFPWHIFFYIFDNKNPKTTFREVDTDGVMFKSFKSLIAFIAQTEVTLRATHSLAIAKVKDQQKIESIMKGLFGK